MHPLRYSSIVTRAKCTVVVLFIWLLSPIIALVQLSWLIPYQQHVEAEPSAVTLQAESIYDVIFLALFFLCPIVFMIFTYARIVLEIARQSRNIHQNHCPTFSKTRSRSRHERKAFAIFAAMLLTYTLCWLPYFSIRRFKFSDLPIPLIYVIFWLRYLVSLLNPCFYILGKQDFRKAICENQVKLDVYWIGRCLKGRKTELLINLYAKSAKYAVNAALWLFRIRFYYVAFCLSAVNRRYRAFSHDVTPGMLVFQNKETAAILVYQTNPWVIELYFYENNFFCFIKLASILITRVKTLYRALHSRDQ